MFRKFLQNVFEPTSATDNMAVGVNDGINQAKVHPDYLESNATSHTWAFSAIAELIDNAYDAKAREIQIEQRTLRGQNCITFQDDGQGMDENRIFKMLSFGFCDKDNRSPVGMYGNGFKSGSMRLGSDALVLTKTKQSASVGFLSQTYLAAIRADTVLVPMVHFTWPDLKPIESSSRKQNLEAILEYSLFKTQEDLLQQIKSIIDTGTLIFIYNLRRLDKFDKIELDFGTDHDIRCPDLEDVDNKVSYRNSLREYCSILFMHPKMKIKIGGTYVKTKLVAKSLVESQKDEYRPRGAIKNYEITFGRLPGSQLSGDYGMMFYRDNRLIKAYEKVGCQKQNDGVGLGVVGVTDAAFLKPTHNKQDFNRDEKYTAAMSAYSIKLKNYWYCINESPSTSSDNSSTDWVQCSDKRCLKWRRLPHGFDMTSLTNGDWYCHMHPGRITCCSPEDTQFEDEEEIQRSTRKKRLPFKRKSQEGGQNLGGLRKKSRCSPVATSRSAMEGASIAPEESRTNGSPGSLLPYARANQQPSLILQTDTTDTLNTALTKREYTDSLSRLLVGRNAANKDSTKRFKLSVRGKSLKGREINSSTHSRGETGASADSLRWDSDEGPSDSDVCVTSKTTSHLHHEMNIDKRSDGVDRTITQTPDSSSNGHSISGTDDLENVLAVSSSPGQSSDILQLIKREIDDSIVPSESQFHSNQLSADQENRIQKLLDEVSGKTMQNKIHLIANALLEVESSKEAEFSNLQLQHKSELSKLKRETKAKEKDIADLREKLEDQTRKLNDCEREKSELSTRLDNFRSNVKRLLRRLAPVITLENNTNMEELVHTVLGLDDNTTS